MIPTKLPPVAIMSDEWMILQFLKKWTGEDIRNAIRNSIDLAALFNEHRSLANGVGWIARRNARPLNPYLSPDNILFWFKERRPDLFQAIIGEPGGVAWLQTQFTNLRSLLGI